MTNEKPQEFYITLEMAREDNADALLAKLQEALAQQKLENTVSDHEAVKPMGGPSELLVHIKMVTEIITALGGAAAATAALLAALKQCRVAAQDLLSDGTPVQVEVGDQGRKPLDQINDSDIKTLVS